MVILSVNQKNPLQKTEPAQRQGTLNTGGKILTWQNTKTSNRRGINLEVVDGTIRTGQYPKEGALNYSHNVFKCLISDVNN